MATHTIRPASPNAKPAPLWGHGQSIEGGQGPKVGDQGRDSRLKELSHGAEQCQHDHIGLQGLAGLHRAGEEMEGNGELEALRPWSKRKESEDEALKGPAAAA